MKNFEYSENKNFKAITSKEQIRNKMKRIDRVFYLFDKRKYSSEKIAEIMEIPQIMVTFWMGTNYFYKLKNKKDILKKVG